MSEEKAWIYHEPAYFKVSKAIRFIPLDVKNKDLDYLANILDMRMLYEYAKGSMNKDDGEKEFSSEKFGKTLQNVILTLMLSLRDTLFILAHANAPMPIEDKIYKSNNYVSMLEQNQPNAQDPVYNALRDETGGDEFEQQMNKDNNRVNLHYVFLGLQKVFSELNAMKTSDLPEIADSFKEYYLSSKLTTDANKLRARMLVYAGLAFYRQCVKEKETSYCKEKIGGWINQTLNTKKKGQARAYDIFRDTYIGLYAILFDATKTTSVDKFKIYGIASMLHAPTTDLEFLEKLLQQNAKNIAQYAIAQRLGNFSSAMSILTFECQVIYTSLVYLILMGTRTKIDRPVELAIDYDFFSPLSGGTSPNGKVIPKQPSLSIVEIYNKLEYNKIYAKVRNQYSEVVNYCKIVVDAVRFLKKYLREGNSKLFQYYRPYDPDALMEELLNINVHPSSGLIPPMMVDRLPTQGANLDTILTTQTSMVANDKLRYISMNTIERQANKIVSEISGIAKTINITLSTNSTSSESSLALLMEQMRLMLVSGEADIKDVLIQYAKDKKISDDVLNNLWSARKIYLDLMHQEKMAFIVATMLSVLTTLRVNTLNAGARFVQTNKSSNVTGSGNIILVKRKEALIYYLLLDLCKWVECINLDHNPQRTKKYVIRGYDVPKDLYYMPQYVIKESPTIRDTFSVPLVGEDSFAFLKTNPRFRPELSFVNKPVGSEYTVKPSKLGGNSVIIKDTKNPGEDGVLGNNFGDVLDKKGVPNEIVKKVTPISIFYSNPINEDTSAKDLAEAIYQATQLIQTKQPEVRLYVIMVENVLYVFWATVDRGIESTTSSFELPSWMIENLKKNKGILDNNTKGMYDYWSFPIKEINLADTITLKTITEIEPLRTLIVANKPPITMDYGGYFLIGQTTATVCRSKGKNWAFVEANINYPESYMLVPFAEAQCTMPRMKPDLANALNNKINWTNLTTLIPPDSEKGVTICRFTTSMGFDLSNPQVTTFTDQQISQTNGVLKFGGHRFRNIGTNASGFTAIVSRNYSKTFTNPQIYGAYALDETKGSEKGYIYLIVRNRTLETPPNKSWVDPSTKKQPKVTQPTQPQDGKKEEINVDSSKGGDAIEDDEKDAEVRFFKSFPETFDSQHEVCEIEDITDRISKSTERNSEDQILTARLQDGLELRFFEVNTNLLSTFRDYEWIDDKQLFVYLTLGEKNTIIGYTFSPYQLLTSAGAPASHTIHSPDGRTSIGIYKGRVKFPLYSDFKPLDDMIQHCDYRAASNDKKTPAQIVISYKDPSNKYTQSIAIYPEDFAILCTLAPHSLKNIAAPIVVKSTDMIPSETGKRKIFIHRQWQEDKITNDQMGQLQLLFPIEKQEITVYDDGSKLVTLLSTDATKYGNIPPITKRAISKNYRGYVTTRSQCQIRYKQQNGELKPETSVLTFHIFGHENEKLCWIAATLSSSLITGFKLHNWNEMICYVADIPTQIGVEIPADLIRLAYVWMALTPDADVAKGTTYKDEAYTKAITAVKNNFTTNTNQQLVTFVGGLTPNYIYFGYPGLNLPAFVQNRDGDIPSILLSFSGFHQMITNVRAVAVLDWGFAIIYTYNGEEMILWTRNTSIAKAAQKIKMAEIRARYKQPVSEPIVVDATLNTTDKKSVRICASTNPQITDLTQFDVVFPNVRSAKIHDIKLDLTDGGMYIEYITGGGSEVVKVGFAQQDIMSPWLVPLMDALYSVNLYRRLTNDTPRPLSWYRYLE